MLKGNIRGKTLCVSQESVLMLYDRVDKKKKRKT